MDFTPAISPDLRLMEPALFEAGPIGLRERMLALPLAQRIEFDPRSKVLFVNFEGLAVDEAGDIDAIELEVTHRVEALGRRVDVVVNYDHFTDPPRAARRLFGDGRAPDAALLRPGDALRGERLPQGAPGTQALSCRWARRARRMSRSPAA